MTSQDGQPGRPPLMSIEASHKAYCPEMSPRGWRNALAVATQSAAAHQGAYRPEVWRLRLDLGRTVQGCHFMTLEMTRGQFDELEERLQTVDSERTCQCNGTCGEHINVAFAYVRDVVLEAAAKHIVGLVGSDNYDAQLAVELAQGIREMKGKP